MKPTNVMWLNVVFQLQESQWKWKASEKVDES